MTKLSKEQRDELIRATDRARQYLREGDRITYSSCPGTKRWGVFVGFSGECVVTKTRDDISARSICKVNGRAMNFGDAGVCEGCAHEAGRRNGMGDWNGTINPRPTSEHACQAIGCPYGYSRPLDEGDDIPF
ncbi:MAG: hypothetical protein CMH13_11095 [Martelella sp.]|uniref:hypothetical protein n=1 Tax=Martelella sp. TaxID=1969699 RepID=UPI000C453E7F|nr:hypothetical protein [Martelella sp.]MAU21065.1 hypothetical protein [Martelella sp.]